MTALREDGNLRGLARSFVPLFRPRIPELVARITSEIQADVPAFAGPSQGRRHRLIMLAVNGAVSHFLDLVEGNGGAGDRVDDLFRKMGYGEALDGHDLTAMRASHRIARERAWDYLRSFAVENRLSAEALGVLGDALLAYIDHLSEQAVIGWQAAHDVLERDQDRNRVRLLETLIDPGLPDIGGLAAQARWPVPERFIVWAIRATSLEEPLTLPELHGDVLQRSSARAVDLVCAEHDADELRRRLDEIAVPGIVIAFSWPVERHDVPDAHRWTARAIELHTAGVIADQPVIDCAQHRTQLWLGAEPALRRGMVQELLRPLLAETPNSREILSETLLAWLETRDSAPAIAARLGVHPQTIRYRWKRINEIFGDDLHEPEFIVQITMLLKASVPLWKAGDQRDFERFHAEEAP
ncbi:helix-turn-helix domain-containing protein [Aeromicrobium piscarium]|uniref:PucR family transcriptional regulator n=1 Tax=Aeromicrobium piscarium TaxID=2590901 RepID=A0A554RUB6_9ACTN|nr:helix-turn-helix domain-containing protein [Aeromicrobium piscarium]TSD57683.1 PucR family transcriptional regulator [Aeromicrobium piscarium]